jgi:predicted nucleic acid-binding protein
VTLVDSNVLLDILTADAKWLAWSVETLNDRAEAGPLYFNEVVYAELAVKSMSEAELDDALVTTRCQLQRIPKGALFLAGKAFGRYRDAGGARNNVLPDFLVGAHAHVARLPLLTRDVSRYRTYFPDIELITP